MSEGSKDATLVINSQTYKWFTLDPSTDSISSEEFLKASLFLQFKNYMQSLKRCSPFMCTHVSGYHREEAFNPATIDMDGCKGAKKFCRYLSHVKVYMLHTGQKDNSLSHPHHKSAQHAFPEKKAICKEHKALRILSFIALRNMPGSRTQSSHTMDGGVIQLQINGNMHAT